MFGNGASSSRYSAARWRCQSRHMRSSHRCRDGYPSSQSPDESATTAIRRGLNQTGYFEAKNVVIEFHYAEGQYDRHQVRDVRSPAANSGPRNGLT